jgi:hypothetical protein
MPEHDEHHGIVMDWARRNWSKAIGKTQVSWSLQH